MHRPTALMAMIVAMAATSGPAQEQRAPVDDQVVRQEVLALVSRTGSVPESAQKKAARLVAEGVAAHDDQKYDKAIQKYRSALEENPLSAAALGEMGGTYLVKGDAARALDAAQRATVLNPAESMYWITKGSALDYLGLADKAIDAYRKAVTLDEHPWLAWLNMGLTYMRRGDLDLAEAALTNARDAAQQQPSPYFHLANLAKVRGFAYVEEDNLKRFVAVAHGDPRLEQANKRLKELTTFEIQIDPSAPHMVVGMIEQGQRALWHGTQHRTTFPEAKAYFPSIEEERDVATSVVAAWREEKANDPKATDERYDLLLKLADAGFLDEYFALTLKDKLQERGTAWIEAHAERVAAFRTWANAQGLAKVIEPPAPAAEPDRPDIVAVLMQALAESPIKYTVGASPSERELDSFLTSEATRFAKALRLSGDDTVECSDALRQGLALRERGVGAQAFAGVFRCFTPTSPEWQRAVTALEGSGMARRPMVPPRLGVVEDKGTEVVVKALASPAALSYSMAKAGWRHEEALRLHYQGGKAYGPSVLEEIYAWTVATQAYFNSKKNATKDGSAFTEDPFFENLGGIARSEHGLRGFVLVEVLHVTEGVSLRSIPASDAQAVVDYLTRFAFTARTDH